MYESEQLVFGYVHLEGIAMAERILIVDDDDDILVAAKLLLKRHFGEVVATNSPEQIPQLLSEGAFDVVVLDMNYSPGERSGREGLKWLERILAIDPEAVVVLITAYSAVDTAVEAMKLGAIDFVSKPWQNERLIATIGAAARLRQSRLEAITLKRRNRELVAQTMGASDAILGTSPAMRAVFEVIEKAAPTEANVLITGENGTGKELVARAIHRQSDRASSVFMSIDLGAVTESLAPSELFGHKQGAFTGATEDRIGRFAAAQGGTLFLDEIGNIPRAFQAKLLTALERREIVPVGSNTAIPIDVRIISATNLPRRELEDESIFRQDLLYRLNTVEVALPPLRDRPGDIGILARHFLEVYARKYARRVPEISERALLAIEEYAWPGNVRALQHAIERAVILSEGDVLTPRDFSLPPSSLGVASEADAASVEATTLAEIERTAISESLRRHTGNVSHAAKELGITRTSLYRRMEKHGL